MADYAIINNDPVAYKEFLLSVLDYLPQLSPDYETEKIFVGGTIDSNQSLFERECLQGRLGVIASSETTGFTLLHFLLMIIDDHHSYVLLCLEDILTEDTEFSMMDAVKCLSEDPEGCYTIHPRNEKSFIQLHRGRTVVNPKKMDLWTLERIRDYIKEEF